MSILRTLILAALLPFSPSWVGSGHAGLYGDPLTFFATCTGRLSAELEFQWLMGAPDAEATAAQRAALIDILDALTPAGDGATVLHLRVSAKMAHAALLTTAQFGTDPDQAARAAQRARHLTQSCTDQVLS